MTVTLTQKQLTDILFQTDDRITKGILDNGYLGNKISDKYLSFKITEKGLFDYGKGVLCQAFGRARTSDQEHPRSLRKALLELKALGYSQDQLIAIHEKARVILFTALDYPTSINKMIRQHCPNTMLCFNEKAFLGMSVVDNTEGYTPDPLNNRPSYLAAVSENDLDELYEYVESHVSSMVHVNPELLTPNKPTKFLM